MVKSSVLLVITTLVLLAQQSTVPLPECGLGRNPDHPCKCMIHTQEVQGQHMADCVMAAMEGGTGPGAATLACAASMPLHCSIAEHYGSWEVGENGEHAHPMPSQCSSACLKRHCRCDDGPTCHFGHTAAMDDPKYVAPKQDPEDDF